ncbi:protein of unknown function [Pseudorhizobium banfieldiae]|uniref:Uncharacterized protein n=1 Tax=Pseudorhizobium banfieldiae TaxID=1125847 RepID=L0NBJ8_9HYPH|nr:protein of unknown function [Pseudorhizobium banfieldiae]
MGRDRQLERHIGNYLYISFN